MSAPVLWWIKKDFRLADNPALTAALEAGETVLPVFLFEPAVLESEETSGFHVAAWCEALIDLRQRLTDHGGDVLTLHLGAVAALDRLHEATGFTEMHSHEEIGTRVTYGRDKAVAAWCADRGVTWHEHRQTAVFRGRLDRNTRSARWNAFMRQRPLAEPSPSDLARVEVPADIPPEAILKHHERPLAGYPAPLVDWWANSKAMKAHYYAIKKLPETKEHAERVYQRHGSRRRAKSRTWKSTVGRTSNKTGTAKTKKPTPPPMPAPLPLFPDA